MAGKCEYCGKAMPQWCARCTGFIGYHCYICGTSVEQPRLTPGHCRCADRSHQWTDGPSPTVGLLVDAAMRMDGADPGNPEARERYMTAIVLRTAFGGGGHV